MLIMQQFYICKSYAYLLVLQLFYINNVKVMHVGYTTILQDKNVMRIYFTQLILQHNILHALRFY